MPVLIAGTASGGANAAGAVVAAVTSIDAGAVAGAANGITLDIALGMIAGVAEGIAGSDATAPPSTIVVQTSLQQGTASTSGETGTLRVAGGSAFTRSPRKAMAKGTVITVATSIIPGTIGHEVTVQHADGTSYVVTIFGASDAELCDVDFMWGVVYDDWDLYLLKQQEEIA